MANEKKRVAAYELEVGGYTCKLRKIDRATLKVVYSKMMKATGEMNLLDTGEIILETCWLEGDKEIKQNDDLWVGACLKCVELIDQKEASLKKL
jgi:hypothetical protein